MSSMHKALCSILNTHAHICMHRGSEKEMEGGREPAREGEREKERESEKDHRKSGNIVFIFQRDGGLFSISLSYNRHMLQKLQINHICGGSRTHQRRQLLEHQLPLSIELNKLKYLCQLAFSCCDKNTGQSNLGRKQFISAYNSQVTVRL